MSSRVSWSGACFSVLVSWNESWDFPSSVACVAGILYTEWSPPVNLPVWPCTWISVPALTSNTSASFSLKIYIDIFSCLICYARCVHWPLAGRIGEGKVSSTILLPSLKWIMWQHLVWSLHTILVVRRCSWFYFMICSPLTMVPEQVHLHGQWLGKRYQECPSTWWPRGDPFGLIF
jgi:hypothetical protein